MKYRYIILMSIMTLGCSQNNDDQDLPALQGEYLGQTPPGMTVELFAPDIVSTGMDELNNVFSHDGDAFYFSVRIPTGGGVSIMEMMRQDNRWSEPHLLPFASRYGDIDMSISPDGNTFFFCSLRPILDQGSPNEDFDFWMSERKDNTWGPPQHLGMNINSESHDFYPVLTSNNTLYFSSQREGQGTNNIYRSQWIDGRFQRAEKLDQAVNTEYREFDPYVSPEETVLIFASERPGGFGSADLYISFKRSDGKWTDAKNIGEAVNSDRSDFCPMLSPDKQYLFFTSSRRKATSFPKQPIPYEAFQKMHNSPQTIWGDIYWIDARIIEILKPEDLR